MGVYMTTINPNQSGRYLPDELQQTTKPAELKSTGSPPPAGADVRVTTGAPTADTMETADIRDTLYLATPLLKSTQSPAQDFLQTHIAAMKDENSDSYAPQEVDSYTKGFNEALNSTSILSSLQQAVGTAQDNLEEAENNNSDIDFFINILMGAKAELQGYQDAQQFIQQPQPPTTPSTPTVGLEETTRIPFSDIQG